MVSAFHVYLCVQDSMLVTVFLHLLYNIQNTDILKPNILNPIFLKPGKSLLEIKPKLYWLSTDETFENDCYKVIFLCRLTSRIVRLLDLPKNSVMQNLGSQVLTENLSLLSWSVTQKTTLVSWKKVLKAARYFNIKVAELGANICAHI